MYIYYVLLFSRTAKQRDQDLRVQKLKRVENGAIKRNTVVRFFCPSLVRDSP